MPASRPHRRRRGVILTPQGVQKLLIAKSSAELEHNAGKRYTLEDLSEWTGLSVDTLVRVLKCEVGVDKETLKSCFRAFKLSLNPEDYTQPKPQNDAADQSISGIVEPELPGGQVALNSAFYIERPPVETNCYKLVGLPGALIRIKAPRQMGKTSLIARVLHHAETLGYRTIALSFQLADKSVFQSLDHLLRWLCINVTLAMKLPNQLGDYWDENLGSKISSKVYFEQYLLARSTQPIVLSLDELDQVFQFPQLTEEFLGLLRAWHEAAKNSDVWKKLRLIIAYSTEVMVPMSLNQSPLNVGLAIELKPFSSQQVQDLVQRYGLEWSESQIERLTSFVGGHPYLVQIALYHIWQQETTLEQLLQMPLSDIEIFSDSLQALAWQPHLSEGDATPSVPTPPSGKQVGAIPADLERNQVEQNGKTLTQKSLVSIPTLPDLPEGSVRLNSPFYVDRSIEFRCYQALCKSGALIRIKAPRQMGKTSLMVRIVNHAEKLGYQTVRLNLQQAEESALNNLDKFLRWFSACISQRLHRPAQLDDYWDQDRGSIFNCTTYLQDHVLETLNSPLVLALDEVDRVFQSTDVAQGFFSMLRIWHEEAKTVELWEQLRLIVSHSTEDYGRLDINQSPFNVGLPIELGEFTSEQVMALAEAHQLSWSLTEVNQLTALVGGHPYLVRLALYHLACQDLSLDQLLAEATTNSGIYEDHLRRHLVMLNQQPKLTTAFQQVVASSEPVWLATMYVYKLYSMGLIKRQGDQVVPRCELYRQYFREHL